MREIFKFELKKILSKKINKIFIFIGLLQLIACPLNWCFQHYIYDAGLKDNVSGRESFELEWQRAGDFGGVLSEEGLTDYVNKIQARAYKYQSNFFDEAGNRLKEHTDYAGGDDLDGEVFANTDVRENSAMASLLVSHYADINRSWGWQELLYIPTEGGIHFYEQRLKKIETLLNMDYSYGNYSEAEKDFWMKKAGGVTTPFAWGSKSSWRYLWDVIQIAFYILFVVVICIAPVFADEYKNRTDGVILSCRYGKTKLITAKLLAALVFSISYMAAGILAGCLVVIAFCGVRGWNLPVQLYNTIIPYNWTFLTACLVTLGIVLLGTAAAAALTLWLSAKTKSAFITLIICMIVLLLPAFIPFSKTSGLFNHILLLFPIYSLNVQDGLKSYCSYQLGGVVISYLGMITITYTGVTALSIFLTKRRFLEKFKERG